MHGALHIGRWYYSVFELLLIHQQRASTTAVFPVPRHEPHLAAASMLFSSVAGVLTYSPGFAFGTCLSCFPAPSIKHFLELEQDHGELSVKSGSDSVDTGGLLRPPECQGKVGCVGPLPSPVRRVVLGCLRHFFSRDSGYDHATTSRRSPIARVLECRVFLRLVISNRFLHLKPAP